jgi:dienelactone hydrolase
MSGLIDRFDERSFSHIGIEREVYSLGKGPDVVILHEIFGLDSQALELGVALSEEFRVHLPLMFGKPGAKGVGVLGACIRREIFLLATWRTSPIVEWLKALCRDVRDRSKSQGVGVIGMCVSGGFALTLVADDSVLAPVVAQASLPFLHRYSLGMSPEDAAAVAERTRNLGGKCVLALRYKRDWIAPGSKIETIRRLIGEGALHYVEIDGSEHSTLTSRPRSPVAYEATRKFLAERLRGAASA